jgi:polyisoprenoid-binding protein YceI
MLTRLSGAKAQARQRGSRAIHGWCGMAAQAGRDVPVHRTRGGQSRKRHWLRWTLAGLGAFIVLVFLAVALFMKLRPVPAPLALPTAGARAPAGPADGTWRAGPGSVAGFRVKESFLGMSDDAVGRTNAVTGTVTVVGDEVTAASFRVDLTTVKVSGKTQQPQFVTSLDTRHHPIATFTLARPVMLGSAFTSGATVTATAVGRLTLRGVSRMTALTFRSRRDGATLRAVGSIPIAFSGWQIKGPKGYGIFGSLDNHGVAEFRLVLRRR